MKNRRIETRVYRPNTRLPLPGDESRWTGDDALDMVIGFVCVLVTLALVVYA